MISAAELLSNLRWANAETILSVPSQENANQGQEQHDHDHRDHRRQGLALHQQTDRDGILPLRQQGIEDLLN